MGASSSTSNSPSQPQLDEETTAASTGTLPALRAAFSNLSQSNTAAIPLPSLQNSLSLTPNTLTLSTESPSLRIPDHFTKLLPNIGASIASQFFHPSGEIALVDWLSFLRGFNRCCSRTSSSSSVETLVRFYAAILKNSDDVPCGLEVDDGDGDNGKVGGRFTPSDLLMLLWVCWIMARCSRISKLPKIGGGGVGGEDDELVVLPDLSHLVLSAFVWCGEVKDDEGVWHCDVFNDGDRSVSAQKVKMWILAVIPGLAQCLPLYVNDCIRACAASKDDVGSSLSTSISLSSRGLGNTHLLTCGTAWSISLTLRTTVIEELVGACLLGVMDETLDNLLYTSSIHGKGFSRFWSKVEGYHGPLLILILATSSDTEGGNSARKWVIGALTDQGLENKDSFYGRPGYLYGISPIFRVLSPSGRDKNFVYCHLNPTVRVYQTNPKPVGLAFGGSIGNERIFIDEDFSSVTIRHHSVDKTYQAGSLIPNQGYLPVEASLLEVEVWGFGGRTAKAQQDAYKNRELLFSEQRRRVDLKSFGNWEDSPEKMMMDMVSDPNKVQREDR